MNSQSATATITSAEKVIHVKVGKASRYEDRALALVEAKFGYDPDLYYYVEELYGDQFYLVEVRIDMGSGIPTFIDAYIIVPDYNGNPRLMNIEFWDNYEHFWNVVSLIRSGNY